MSEHSKETQVVKASTATVPSKVTISPRLFNLTLDKKWILEKAIPFNDQYNKIEIPQSTSINMRGVHYSVYGSIDILVDRITDLISVSYTDSTLVSETVETPLWCKVGFTYFEIMFAPHFSEDKIDIDNKELSLSDITKLELYIDPKFSIYSKPFSEIEMWSIAPLNVVRGMVVVN